MTHRWSKFNHNQALTAEEAEALVKRLVSARIGTEPGEILFAAINTSPTEAATVANRVAEIYCQERREQNIRSDVIGPARQSVCLHPREKRLLTCAIGAFGGLLFGFVGGSAAAWSSARRQRKN